VLSLGEASFDGADAEGATMLDGFGVSRKSRGGYFGALLFVPQGVEVANQMPTPKNHGRLCHVASLSSPEV
jgi:hypothetical protein